MLYFQYSDLAFHVNNLIIIYKLLYSYLRTPKQVYVMIPNLLVYYNIYPISKCIILFKKLTLHENLLFGLYHEI